MSVPEDSPAARPPSDVLRPDVLRLAMWSGPRNISTALMRAWSSRADTFVTDEPLYAHYLQATGVSHPGRQAVLAAHDADWRRVAAWLTGPVPQGRRHWYQKHMAHHLLPQIERPWLDGLRHAFLIREPAEMLTSLLKVTPAAGLADTGLPQQLELFERVAEREGRAPPVLDAADVLRDPRRALTALCEALGVPFDEAMLSWKPGPHPDDGVWGPHWYEAVWRSTGFQPPRDAAHAESAARTGASSSPRPEPASAPASTSPTPPPELLAACRPYYLHLHRHRLGA
ncbi:MAG: HAD family hydrolase [Planctomycetota bacterium]